jgi:diguanylate cyclase (GGDEF)-like protein
VTKPEDPNLDPLEAERRRHREELALVTLRFNTAINNMSQGLCFFDGSQRLIVCNDLYAAMYRLTRELVRPGTTLREIVDHRFAANSSPNMSREDYLKWRDSIAITTVPTDTEVTLQDGRVIAIHHQPMPDGGWVATHEDITERRRAEISLRSAKEQLEMLAQHDPLTGLANRRKFSERFEYDAARARRSRAPLSVLMVDIDHFKGINDRLGHAAGDACLKDLASLLSSSARTVDLIARFGGEEFVALLPDTSLEGALLAGERIRAQVESHPGSIDGARVALTVSVGAASMPATQASEAQLLEAADRALYRAKRAGRNRVSA